MFGGFGFRRLIGFLIHWAIIIIFFYAVGEAIGWEHVRNFMIAMFGPWFELIESYDIQWSEVFLHPIALILGAAFLLKSFSKFR